MAGQRILQLDRTTGRYKERNSAQTSADSPVAGDLVALNSSAKLDPSLCWLPAVNCFRLTTESGQPVSTADRTSQSTLYLTPCGWLGSQISLYTGSVWQVCTTSQVSVSLSSLTSGKNYDVYAYWTGSAVALELSAAWTNDTTRADTVTTQEGVWVKSGATTRRLVGTVRTTGTTTIEDSLVKPYVWNAANQVVRPFKGPAYNLADLTIATTTLTVAQSALQVGLVVGSPALIEVRQHGMVGATVAGTTDGQFAVQLNSAGFYGSGQLILDATQELTLPFSARIPMVAGFNTLDWGWARVGTSTVRSRNNSRGAAADAMHLAGSYAR